MNYSLHYQRLMDRAETREFDGYGENHHVVPRCIDKSSTHTVRLTPEEHYVAHQLLVKMYPGHTGLVYAANMMTVGRFRVNKLYGWLRRRISVEMSSTSKNIGMILTFETI